MKETLGLSDAIPPLLGTQAIPFAGIRTATAFLNVGTGAGTRKMPQKKINL